MKSLIVRGVTGIVFVAVLIAAMLYGSISFGILFAIVSGLAVNEFCNLIHQYKKTTFSTLLAIMGGIYLFFIPEFSKSILFNSFISCLIIFTTHKLQSLSPEQSYIYLLKTYLHRYIIIIFFTTSNTPDPCARTKISCITVSNTPHCVIASLYCPSILHLAS